MATTTSKHQNIRGVNRSARFGKFSRYVRNSTIYRDTRQNDALKIDYQRPIILANDNDTVIEILPSEAWRPDLVAERVYNGRSELGWVLQIYNSKFHVRDFQPGVMILVPALNRLLGTIL